MDDDNPLDPSVLDPVPAPVTALPALPVLPRDCTAEDFTFARDNVRMIIQDGMVSLEQLTRVAITSQQPRAYEVMAKAIDTLVAANARLLEMQERMRDIEAKDSGGIRGPETEKTTNNLFIGSTAELQQMLKDLRKRD